MFISAQLDTMATLTVVKATHVGCQVKSSVSNNYYIGIGKSAPIFLSLLSLKELVLWRIFEMLENISKCYM